MTEQTSNLRLLRLPLSGPTGGSGLTQVDILVVELSDNSGHTGLGFSYVLGADGTVACHAARQLTDGFVNSQTPCHPIVLHRRMKNSLNRIGRGAHYLAMAAIDVAAWDLYAKRLGAPLGEAMGGAMRAVPVYGSAGFRPNMDASSLVERAMVYVDAGCQAIKLRLAGQPDDGQMLSTVRQALPATVDIMVDINEKSRAGRAQLLANLCAESGVLWLEEPLAAHDIAGFQRLAVTSSTPIALGEHLQGVEAFKPFIEQGLMSIAQPDLAMMGGLTECLATAQLCDMFGIEVAPHFLPSLFIHLAAAVPNLTWLEDFPLIEPIFREIPTFDASGFMQPPTSPGHGLELDDSTVADIQVA